MKVRWLILISIILLSAALRFYRLPDLFVFTVDEEYQASIADTLVKHFHIIWIGVSAAHVEFYLGPFWSYFTAFWLFLFRDPIITAYIAAFIGVLTTILAFVTGFVMFNFSIGLSASLLYAALPLMVFFDQKYWNPTLIPFLSLVMVLSLFLSNKNLWWWVVFVAAVGLIFHVHLSLFPFIFLGIYIYLSQRKNVPRKVILYSILVFLVIMAPLIAFDYFHKGSNITTPLRLIQFNRTSKDQTEKTHPTQHLESLFQSMGRIWYLYPNRSNADENNWGCTSVSEFGSDKSIDKTSSYSIPPSWISALSVLILLTFLLNPFTWKDRTRKILALSMLSVISFFLIFPGGAYEYYLLAVFPLIIFTPLLLISDFTKKSDLPLTLFVIIISIIGINTVINANADFGMTNKKELIKEVSNFIQSNDFYLTSTGKCHQYDGWRYLFKSYGFTPKSSYTDSSLSWLYSKEISKDIPKYEVVIAETREGIPINSSKAIKQFSSGGYTAFIFVKSL